MTDIVERLRKYIGPHGDGLMREAADEIERLRALRKVEVSMVESLRNQTLEEAAAPEHE